MQTINLNNIFYLFDGYYNINLTQWCWVCLCYAGYLAHYLKFDCCVTYGLLCIKVLFFCVAGFTQDIVMKIKSFAFFFLLLFSLVYIFTFVFSFSKLILLYSYKPYSFDPLYFAEWFVSIRSFLIFTIRGHSIILVCSLTN